MTKPRAPLSFGLAIRTVVELVGPKRAAHIVRRAVRTVQHWSDSERRGLPTLDQAIALDRAFVAAGGGYAPILESYARQLEMDVVDQVACRAALAEDIALVSRESGDALGHCIQALQSGAAPAVIHRAISETEEVDALIPRLLGRLKALLPTNGVGSEDRGKSS